jgi:hypothetical protein
MGELRLVPFLALIAGGGTGCAQAQPPVIFLGAFSNMRYTEEHAYGYTVQLWRAGPDVFGLFLASAGLAGDTPAGVLDDVRFDEKTATLSFNARLTLGMTIAADGRQQPTRDRFSFDGRLSGTRLVGTVKHSSGGATETVRVILDKRRAEEPVRQPRTYAEWKLQADEILRQRGPKW